MVYCGATVFDGFLHKKQAKVTHKVETAIRAERTATWNGVKVASESVIRCQKIISNSSPHLTPCVRLILMQTHTVKLAFELKPRISKS